MACRALLETRGYEGEEILVQCEEHGEVIRFATYRPDGSIGVPLDEINGAWAVHQQTNR